VFNPLKSINSGPGDHFEDAVSDDFQPQLQLALIIFPYDNVNIIDFNETGLCRIYLKKKKHANFHAFYFTQELMLT
jgi:hypothetical protein